MNTNNRNNRRARKKTGPNKNIQRRGKRNMAAQQITQPSIRSFVVGQSTRIRGPTPDSITVDLHYVDQTFVRNNAGGTYLSWRYRINSAYDPDPLLGTGAITGFVEWASFYTHYRVVKFSYQVQISNNETFPLFVTCCPTLLDPGANYIGIGEMGEMPYGKKSILSAKGGMDKASFRGTVGISQLEGTTESIFDSTFSSQTTTNPGQIRFFTIGAVTGGAVLVNGVFVSVRLNYETLFYARTILLI